GSRWNAALDAMEQNRQSVLGGMMNGFNTPSKLFKVIEGQLYEEERAFIEGLRALRAPMRYGTIAKMLQVLQTFDKLLRDNYKDLLYKLASINSLQETETGRLLSTVAETSKAIFKREADAIPAFTTAVGKLKAFIGDLSRDDGISLVRSAEAEVWNSIDRTL